MPTAPSSASYTTLERLRTNDSTLTKLKLVAPHDSLVDLLEALRHNHTIKYVLLERGFFRGLASAEEWIAVLQAVGRMRNVEEVEVWSVRVPLQALCQAFQHSKCLTRLGFGFVTLAGPLDASALCGHASLKTFYLSDFRLSEEDANLASLCHALSTCPKLKNIEVFQYQQETPPFSARGLASLMESPSLHHLTLRRLKLTADLTAELAQKLSTNHNLQKLNLNENQLGNAGCAAFGQALSTNSTLQELDLRKNDLTAANELTQPLMANKTLEKLNLACNPLQDEGAQGMAKLLQVHPSLKTLELHRTHLTDVGCACLMNSLRQNTSLVHLDLSFNEITEATYLQVAEALKTDNRTLKTINLQVNKKMKVQACQALLQMVKENTTLEQINTLIRVRFEPQEYYQVEETLHQMNLYLRLNHAGRQRLLQGTASLQDWVSAMTSLHDTLDGIHHLVQANPTLLCGLQQQPTPTNKTPM